MARREQKRDQQGLGAFLIYGMLILVIVMITFFWVELKKQNDDQFKTKINTLQSQPKNDIPYDLRTQNKEFIQNFVEPIQIKEATVDEKQKGKEKQIKEGIESFRQQFIKDPTKPYNTYLFETIQNWDLKQAMNLKFRKDGTESQTTSIYTKTTTETRPPSRTNVPSPQPAPSTPANPASRPPPGSLRANITAAQLDLAKRLQKLKDQPSTSEIAIEQKEYYEQKYKLSQYPEQPFCIVVPSFNNTAQNRYIHNMNSILMQDYSNYHIVFIDDASEDETGRLMKLYAQDHQISEKKLKIIVNANRTMAMPNLYRSAKEFCKPYQIYMIVDGDDELLGRQVLKHFNYLFQSKDIWVAYTNFISIRGSIGYSRPYSQNIIDRNAYRKSGFVISHLRAFYTKLFASVNIEDLQDEDHNWFRAANDVAMYMPILEMTHTRLTYCPELSYLYNSNTGLNNHRVKLKEQKGNEKKVKQKPSYKALEQLFTEEEKRQLKESLGRKIPIKDPNLPAPPFQVKKYGWEE